MTLAAVANPRTSVSERPVPHAARQLRLQQRFYVNPVTVLTVAGARPYVHAQSIETIQSVFEAHSRTAQSRG